MPRSSLPQNMPALSLNHATRFPTLRSRTSGYPTHTSLGSQRATPRSHRDVTLAVITCRSIARPPPYPVWFHSSYRGHCPVPASQYRAPEQLGEAGGGCGSDRNGERCQTRLRRVILSQRNSGPVKSDHGYAVLVRYGCREELEEL